MNDRVPEEAAIEHHYQDNPQVGNPGLILYQWTDPLWAVCPMFGGDIVASEIQSRSNRITPPRFSSPANGSVKQRIAIIPVDGVLSKYGSLHDRWTSYLDLAEKVRSAGASSQIDGIVLKVDSLGGHTKGLDTCANAIADIAKRKPVVSYVEDHCSSAAYWLASQANKVFVSNKTARVGGIGLYFGVYDLSKNYADRGIKPVLIRSGKFKGAGWPGTVITDEQKAEWQRQVDVVAAEFYRAVGRTRPVNRDRLEEITTGKDYLAGDAVKLGLVDGIRTLSATIDAVRKGTNRTARN
ncbi:Putative signal peptide peptidase SppA [Planctomycetes bacterium Pan216]|uniref:Signal peptide peptidase SppA n=1 Tax=Kolteria novifilia TaxID=2527975 RepID=A0A518B0B9_9BACT|nr:Putative signal peptide peptidase SppA [Planctomycetes bacterium Pan216]